MNVLYNVVSMIVFTEEFTTLDSQGLCLISAVELALIPGYIKLVELKHNNLNTCTYVPLLFTTFNR